jgi:HK97 family phage major capsid protein
LGRFHIETLAGRGQLKAGIPVNDDEIDFKAIEEYKDTFPTYLRRDERGFETKALQVSSEPDGGYWVPDAMSNRIVTKVFESVRSASLRPSRRSARTPWRKCRTI